MTFIYNAVTYKAEPPMTTRLYVLAVDVEAWDDQIGAPLVAVGMCLGSGTTGTVMEKKRWCITLPPGSIEQAAREKTDCYTYFWSKRLSQLATMQAEAQPAAAAAASIASTLKMWQDRVLDELQGDLIIVSDNPSYDLGKLDHFLYTHHARRYSIRYREPAPGKPETYKYLGVEDISPQCYFDPTAEQRERRAKEFADKCVTHDHWPDNDAHHHFSRFAYMAAAASAPK